MPHYPSFLYPFGHAAQSYFADAGVYHIRLFSYGSLLHRESASRTLSAAVLDTMQPAIAYGVQRIFNRDVDLSGSKRYTFPTDPLERGMLNLMQTEEDRMMNGVVVTVPIEEITPLCTREIGYDFIPVRIAPLPAEHTDPSNMSNDIAYTFLAHEGTTYVDNSIVPIQQYYQLCRDGAASFGQEFLDMWLDTTFLGDKKTSVRVWEQTL